MSLLKNLVLVSCVAVALFGVLQTQANAALVASWGLDENPITVGTTQAVCSNTADNMTYQTSATSVAGYWPSPDKAVDFGGTGYAVTGALTAGTGIVYGLSNSTVECFFKMDSVPAGDKYMYCEGSTAAPYLALYVTGNTVGGNACGTSGWAGNASPNLTITAGKWYYAAMTYNSAGYISTFVYDLTGATYASATSSGTAATKVSGINYAYLGSQYYSGIAGFFPGTIDNVKLYDSVLTQAQMIADATTAPVPEPGTLALLAAGLAGLLCYAWRKRR